jgi:acyl-CoA reductase-like NAD-dependent aldehyde dehydrogenase
MEGVFAMGIKIGELDSENSLEDYKVTLVRIAMVAKFDREMASTLEKKDRDACGNLIKEADKALKKAKEREAAKTRLHNIIEAGRDKLVVLAKRCRMKLKKEARLNSLIREIRSYLIKRM